MRWHAKELANYVESHGLSLHSNMEIFRLILNTINPNFNTELEIQ